MLDRNVICQYGEKRKREREREKRKRREREGVVLPKLASLT